VEIEMGIKIEINHDKKEAYFFQFEDMSEDEREYILEMIAENPFMAMRTPMTIEEMLLDVEGSEQEMSTFRTTLEALERAGYELMRVTPLPDNGEDEIRSIVKDLLNKMESSIELEPENEQISEAMQATINELGEL
jgi:hypothetical protein